MKTRDYDTIYNDTTGGTETHLAVDEAMQDKNAQAQHVYEEGFAASSGVRQETAETGGRIKHPEMKDDSRPDRVPDSIEEENAGLADS